MSPDRFVCWSCDGAGEQERTTGVVTTCQACDGEGLLSEGTIRRMWRAWKYDEIPEDVTRQSGISRERVGRLVVDAELSDEEKSELIDSLSCATPFHAEKQTEMRIDVYRIIAPSSTEKDQ